MSHETREAPQAAAVAAAVAAAAVATGQLADWQSRYTEPELVWRIELGEQVAQWMEMMATTTSSRSTSASSSTSPPPPPVTWKDWTQQWSQDAEQLKKHLEQERQSNRQLLAMIQQSQQQTITLQQQVDRLQHELQDQQQHRLVSSLRGRQAEQEWGHKLKQYFPEGIMEDKAKSAQSGDIWLIDRDGFTVLIDIKSYTSNVGKREIEKFQRDIHVQAASSCIQAGILLSTQTNIYTKPHMSVEFVGHSPPIPVLFLTQMDSRPQEIVLAVQVLKSIAKTLAASPTLTQGVEFQGKCQRLMSLCKQSQARMKDLYTFSDNLRTMIQAEEESWKTMLGELVEWM